jgi:pyruvate/2-oxoglutarate dehydrogenase complex dihydrolipoamide acyltransferase (E2) component
MTVRRAVFAVCSAGVVFAVGFAAYMLGENDAPSAAEAKAERELAFDAAFAVARRDAFERGVERGQQQGTAKGRVTGTGVGTREGRLAAESEAELRAAEAAAAEAEADAAEQPVVICDGAIADDAHYAACLEQSGQPIPAGFPGGPARCTTEPPFPIEGPCAGVRP